MSRETYCPPPVQRFLRINDKVYRRMNGAVIHMNEVAGEEVVVRCRVVRGGCGFVRSGRMVLGR